MSPEIKPKLSPLSPPIENGNITPPQSSNPSLWQSIKYLLRPTLVRNLILMLLLFAAFLGLGKVIVEKAGQYKTKGIDAKKVQVKINDPTGKPFVDSNLEETIKNLYANILELKSHFVITDAAGKPTGQQIGNLNQFLQDEIRKLTPQ